MRRLRVTHICLDSTITQSITKIEELSMPYINVDDFDTKLYYVDSGAPTTDTDPGYQTIIAIHGYQVNGGKHPAYFPSVLN